MNATILVLDDEESIRFTFKLFLEKEGYHVLTAESYQTALEVISQHTVDMIFADIALGDQTGIDVLKAAKERGINCPVVMITGRPSVDSAAESVRAGAFDYLQKPVEKQNLLRIASHGLRHKFLHDEKQRIEAENERYRHNLEAIFRSVQECIITVDTNMQIIEANEAVEKFFHVNHQEIIGKKFTDIMAGSYQVCCKVLEETLETQQEGISC
jgi:two-component system, NtrC family, response regulator HydG